MYCINCGKELSVQGKFCPYCGKKIDIAPTEKNDTNVYNEPPVVPKQSAEPKAKVEPNYPIYEEPLVQEPPVYQDNSYSSSIPHYTPVNPPKKKKNGCLIAVGVTAAVVIGITILLGVAIAWLFEDDYEDEFTNDGRYEDNFGGQDEDFEEFMAEGDEETFTNSESSFVETDLGLTDVRDFYTTIKDDGSDVVTVMVYLLGSDLESDSGCATDDLIEIQEADFGDNVNVIVMTGGTKEWQNDLVGNNTCEYWQVKDGEITCLEDLGKISMVDPDTLSDFISYSASMFPANRYQLIMWNHGGGTMAGFGYDENYPNDVLHLDDIADALEKASVYFDFVGFDACLMGTVETAVMLEPYADYMIASAELEPGSGWYYTDWLTTLGNDTSISTVDLGVQIIDDFVESVGTGRQQEEATLSIVELPQITYTYEMLREYFSSATLALQSNSYNTIATARSDAKDYGEGEYEQVDAVDFVDTANLDGSQEVVDAINNAVKYYNSSSVVGEFYGIAIYFPYYYPSDYSTVQEILLELGYADDYMDFFSAFISSMSGGQSQHRTNSSDTDYTNEDWYDEEFAQIYADAYEDTVYNELYITEKNDGFVLQLSDEAWEEITYIELQVLLDDGEGYIDLGSDNVYEFDRDGDLLIEFDYTWVALDGNIVPFYAEKEEENSDGSWYTYGMVPAMLNGEEYIEIIVYWDSDNPEGYVAGYRKSSETTSPMGKGLFELESGDVLQWVFDYYDYDVNYQDSYIMGDSYTVGNSDIKVSYDYVGDQDALVYFSLTDIYNNIYNSEAIIYTD